MIGAETAAYGVGTLALLAGTAIAAALLADDSLDAARGRFGFLLIIPGFAALSYVAMTLDVGTVTVHGREVLIPRYVDWLVTTPILVGYTGYVAGADRSWVLGLSAADAGMIAAGWVATTTAGTLRWGAFAVSMALFLAILAGFYVGYAPAARELTSQRRHLYLRLASHIVVLWLVYPAVWLVGPAGFGLVSAAGAGLVIVYMDVAAKSPFAYVVWEHRDVFRRDDAAAWLGGGADADAGAPAATDRGAGAGAGDGPRSAAGD